MNKFEICGQDMTVERFNEILESADAHICVSEFAMRRVEESRKVLDMMVEQNRVVYGVNTGMGGFVNYLVPNSEISNLQDNLIKSVATNVGEPLPERIVLGAILARVNSLARGNSGITSKNLNILVQLYNKRVIPFVPQKGSLGASGDLGPLAAIALVATGQWWAYFHGKKMTGAQALEAAGIAPMKLSHKEGLALINGTSAMTAFAAVNVSELSRIFDQYVISSALTLESLKCKSKPFHPTVHEKKPHAGQLKVATAIHSILQSSKMIVDEDSLGRALSGKFEGHAVAMSEQIEDAYSARCTPQILGPVLDTIDFVKRIVENELNSSNDNPLIIPEQNDAFHNGHFHGQYIAMAMDYLAIAATCMTNLADRRIDRFMDAAHSNGLPPFLCSSNQGTRFGLMGGQFMSTSITAENRSLCNPLSIQTLTSTGDFQDVVSMGLIAARRCSEIINNLKYVISFEIMCACQAADLRGADALSEKTKALHKKVRDIVPFLNEDAIITQYMEELAASI